MRSPAIQLYFGDWRRNSNLMRCSWAARGAWIEIMAFMHDADRYGVLTWPLKEIAQAVGCPFALVTELVNKGVLKGCDKGACDPYVYTPRSGRRDGEPVTLIGEEQGPIWYSPKMVAMSATPRRGKKNPKPATQRSPSSFFVQPIGNGRPN